MKPGVKHLKSTACAIATVLLMLGGTLQAQQFPIPQTAAEVPGPTSGPMTKAYVQMVGRMAYVWGWPLVYVLNQRTELTKVPETGLLAGVMPISPMNQMGMLTGYIDPGETFIAIPNQDVVYGLGYLSLAQEPVVLQVPDFGNRFWTFPVYDARTDEIHPARPAIRHQARFLHGRRAELERRNSGRHCRRRALVHRLRRGDAAHLHGCHRPRIARPSSPR